MENGAIPNNRIGASSTWDGNHAASQGRLNFKETTVKSGAWVAKADDGSPWLQIDLSKPDEIITRVATQGRNWNVHWLAEPHNQWVTKYTLQCSDDCVSFQDYKGEQNTVQVSSNDQFCTNLL